PPILEFQDVSKRFADQQVLDAVSLSVEAGEAVGLVGVNGAGKTTLIRALLDLCRADAGSITINGLPSTTTAARRHLAYLAERFTPPPFATGHELLRHLVKLHGAPYDRAAAAREAAALDLDPEALERPAARYSKGMTQKLGLVACILPGCPLLVLDEPMSGLDPRARAQFKRRLAALKAAGTTLFFSTHLLVDVETLCDRIAVLEGGSIVFDGAPAALLEQSGATSLEEAFLTLLPRQTG
ncbi:MAG: ABC transporter ATP-binding protein, partial [Gammaproteobacteria bacterium]